MIPQELLSFQQWVCTDTTKIPIDPKTGKPAAVNDPSTWGSYEQARAKGPYVGFVLTENDPYAVIDLDETENPEQLQVQRAIYEKFDSYSEISLSGKGCHIWVRGSVPEGRKRGPVEVYSSGRYMICTGNVLHKEPIADRQQLLDLLYDEMKSTDVVGYEDGEEVESDATLVDRATNAENGDKFIQLCSGNWEGEYPSQSEADYALLSFLCFYSRNSGQVKRIFRMTGLGQRDKATRNDKYLDRSILKIREHEPPPVDAERLFEALALVGHQQMVGPEVVPAKVLAEGPQPRVNGNIVYPPGLLGEIAHYIYSAAPRPVGEVGLMAALGLLSGIAGRAYNMVFSGLNQYLVVLAPTGSGKEGAHSGIDQLVSAIRPNVPMVDRFIGPSAFASGQAMIRALDDRPCFVSLLGEFGHTLAQLCDPKASPSTVMLRRVMLDLYTKSGWGRMLRSSVYADVEKNTREVNAPAITLLGESTPEIFYGAIDASRIAEGLIPRFSILEYTGKRPRLNDHPFMTPDQIIVDRLTELVIYALTHEQNMAQPMILERMCDPKAYALLREYNDMVDQIMVEAQADIELQLWNRAHLKALRIAGLLAVGQNIHNPRISFADAEWATRFVQYEVTELLNRYRSGQAGSGEIRLEHEIKKVVIEYLAMTKVQRARYEVPAALLDSNAIPYSYLRRRLRRLTMVREHKLGPKRAVEDAVADLTTAGILEQVPQKQALEQFKVRSKLFVLGEAFKP